MSNKLKRKNKVSKKPPVANPGDVSKMLRIYDELHRSNIDKYSEAISKDNTMTLMVCFALAERRVHKFGRKRIMDTLKYIDEMMGEINSGNKSIYDYHDELIDETGISIKC